MTGPADTKQRLLDAAERLFARDGIHAARIREINELAGQRNPSALHYHFGSRIGVVEAILLRFQSDVDVRAGRRLDELELAGRAVGTRPLVDAVARPLVEKLDTQSGRDCVRIIPQILPALSRNLRRGVVEPITPQTRRILTALDAEMARLGIPERHRRERLVSYTVVLTSLLGERAQHLEDHDEPLLDQAEFATHLINVLDAVLVAAAS